MHGRQAGLRHGLVVGDVGGGPEGCAVVDVAAVSSVFGSVVVCAWWPIIFGAQVEWWSS